MGPELCHSYGKCYGNYEETKKEIIPGDWQNERIIKTYKDYKFVLAMENSCIDGYITEKIINAFYSGAIPIYWGSSNINEFFNEKAFINLNKFHTFEDGVNYVINMNEDEIKKISNEPIYNNSDMRNFFDDNVTNAMLDKYINTLEEFLK